MRHKLRSPPVAALVSKCRVYALKLEGGKLAMDMFSYRLVKAVGAYLSALGGAYAIVFGGGIDENNTLVRERLCTSLRWCGLKMDAEKNRALSDRKGKISTAASRLQVLAVLTQEGLKIAHEGIQMP